MQNSQIFPLVFLFSSNALISLQGFFSFSCFPESVTTLPSPTIKNPHRKSQMGFRTPPPPLFHSINLIKTSYFYNIAIYHTEHWHSFRSFCKKSDWFLDPPPPPGHPLSFSVSLSISHSDTRNSPPPQPMPNSPSVSFCHHWSCEFVTRDPISCLLSLLNVLNVYKHLNDQDHRLQQTTFFGNWKDCS